MGSFATVPSPMPSPIRHAELTRPSEPAVKAVAEELVIPIPAISTYASSTLHSSSASSFSPIMGRMNILDGLDLQFEENPSEDGEREQRSGNKKRKVPTDVLLESKPVSYHHDSKDTLFSPTFAISAIPTSVPRDAKAALAKLRPSHVSIFSISPTLSYRRARRRRELAKMPTQPPISHLPAMIPYYASFVPAPKLKSKDMKLARSEARVRLKANEMMKAALGVIKLPRHFYHSRLENLSAGALVPISGLATPPASDDGHPRATKVHTLPLSPYSDALFDFEFLPSKILSIRWEAVELQLQRRVLEDSNRRLELEIDVERDDDRSGGSRKPQQLDHYPAATHPAVVPLHTPVAATSPPKVRATASSIPRATEKRGKAAPSDPPTAPATPVSPLSALPTKSRVADPDRAAPLTSWPASDELIAAGCRPSVDDDWCGFCDYRIFFASEPKLRRRKPRKTSRKPQPAIAPPPS